MSLLFGGYTFPYSTLPPSFTITHLATSKDSVLSSTHKRKVSVEQLQGEPPQVHKVPSLAPVDPSVGSGKFDGHTDLADAGKGTAVCQSDACTSQGP